MDNKKHLCELDLQYALLYPACLRVVAKGEVHFFDRPAAATHWLDREARLLHATISQCPTSTWVSLTTVTLLCSLFLAQSSSCA